MSPVSCGRAVWPLLHSPLGVEFGLEACEGHLELGGALVGAVGLFGSRRLGVGLGGLGGGRVE